MLVNGLGFVPTPLLPTSPPPPKKKSFFFSFFFFKVSVKVLFIPYHCPQCHLLVKWSNDGTSNFSVAWNWSCGLLRNLQIAVRKQILSVIRLKWETNQRCWTLTFRGNLNQSWKAEYWTCQVLGSAVPTAQRCRLWLSHFSRVIIAF